MNRLTLAATAAPLLLTAGLVVALPAVTASAAPPTCMGQEATLVGPGVDGELTGTAGVDVVVTNGATEVDTLGGNDLVCVTNVDGDTSVVTSTGKDAVEMTDGAVFSGAAARRAAGAVTIDTGEDDDAFYSYADIRSDGVGPGGTVDLGPGADRARVLVSDSFDVGTPAGTTGPLDLDGGAGADRITFSTDQLVEIIEPDDGEIDIDMAEGTADVSGRTQVDYASFESMDVRSSGHLTIDGTDGPDVIKADACGATIKTGPGSDRIDLTGNVGEQDEYVCGREPTRIYSGAHSDVVRLAAFGVETDRREFVPVVRGGAGGDLIEGRTYGASSIRAYGDAGNDRILGGEDWSADLPGFIDGDVLAGGPGDDVLYGFGGPDSIYGGPGRDRALGGTERDLCRAEAEQGCER